MGRLLTVIPEIKIIPLIVVMLVVSPAGRTIVDLSGPGSANPIIVKLNRKKKKRVENFGLGGPNYLNPGGFRMPGL